MLVFSVLFPLTGCAEFFGTRQSRYTSSVVDYLYPKTEIAAIPSIPHLSLPLNVGIAFVPESGAAATYRLNRKEKTDLMNRISSEFRTLPFVKDIELIPTDYLAPGGGFTNLDQIRTMYDIDVIALISYDQVQHTDEGLLSIFSQSSVLGCGGIRRRRDGRQCGRISRFVAGLRLCGVHPRSDISSLVSGA